MKRGGGGGREGRRELDSFGESSFPLLRSFGEPLTPSLRIHPFPGYEADEYGEGGIEGSAAHVQPDELEGGGAEERERRRSRDGMTEWICWPEKTSLP